MNKKNVKHLELIIAAAVIGLVVIALVFAKLFPSPYGPNLKLITRLIFLGVCVAAVAMIIMVIIRARRNHRLLKFATAILSLLLVLVIVINFAFMPAHIVLGLVLSRMDREEKDLSGITAAARELTEQIESEGLVLLKNEGTLPLTTRKINVFGYASRDMIYGGSGSGAGDESVNVTLHAALNNAGFELNTELMQFYEDNAVDSEAGFVVEMLGSNYNVPEPEISKYSEELINGAKNFSDTAVVVISRSGGEGADMPMEMENFTGGTKGRHYLEITENEQAMLDMVCQNFDNVVVLINSSSAMELGFLEAQGVDSAIWIGGPGSTGLNAVAKALTGDVNPSGRLVDTYAYDLTSSPAYYNAGSFTYTGSEHDAAGLIATLTGKKTDMYHFLNYAEGIYVGYRYYETAAADGFIDYEKTVQYPFGYGLSYTTFEQKMGDLKVADGKISVDVTVKNIGETAGKEVVQLYYTAPYTKGGIEKSHVVLCGFDKTQILQPGESETVTISFNIEDMASYDYKEAKAYVLEEGDYEIKLMKNAHEMIDSRVYTVDQTVTGRQSDLTPATNLFDDAQGDFIYLSRADWEGTFPKERTKDQPITEELMAALDNMDAVIDPEAQEVVFADHGLTLADVKGLAYDDPKWDMLLEQLSVSDMEYLIGSSGWQSPTIHSVGKPTVIDVDGPAGINGMFNRIMGTHYTSEVVVAATWNTELVEEFGKTLGQEGVLNGIAGLYGPAMNIHRTPFSGRNFEYYSEDGFLSGKMGAAMVQGVNSQGVYTFIKHFALNDQETNCRGVATWSNEQAIRELYLKPFEISVKEGGATAVMSAFNRIGTVWAGACEPLLRNVLRGEWGFEGMVITDNTMSGAYMDADQAIFAGNDMILTPVSHRFDTGDTASGHQQMRTACHNILYTVANSVALDVVPTGLPTWIVYVVVTDLVVLSLIMLGFMGATKKKKIKKIAEESTQN